MNLSFLNPKALLLAGVLGLNCMSGQVLFTEDFDGIAGPTGGGAGTYNFPTGWTLINQDGLTPNTSVSYFGAAWIRREDFTTTTDTVMASTSWYTPAGTSNDWAFTPGITLPASGTIELEWTAKAQDPSYPDGYEVRISTTTPTIAGATTTLFSIPSENSTWTTRTVDLSAYVGQTVYIAFRNNSTDQFILLVDDVSVKKLAANDATLETADPGSEYSRIPVDHTPTMNLSGEVKNSGTSTLSAVKVRAFVVDGTSTIIHRDSLTIASIAAGATTPFTFTSLPINFTGIFTSYYDVVVSGDANPGDNMKNSNDTLIVTDTTWARDNNIATGTLGIGAGEPGYLGQIYVLPSSDTLTSITVGLNDSPGLVSTCVYSFNAGVPGTLLAVTDTMDFTGSPSGVGLFDFNFTTPVILPGDTFLICVQEIDSNVRVLTSPSKFTLGTTWVNWASSSLGWANNEDYSFNVSYILRANFGHRSMTTGLNRNLDNMVSIYPNPSNGMVNLVGLFGNDAATVVTVLNTLGEVVYTTTYGSASQLSQQLNLSHLPAGVYNIKVTHGDASTVEKVTIQ